MTQPGLLRTLAPNLFLIELSAALYEPEAVMAAALRCSDRFHVKLEPRGDMLAVLFECRDAEPPPDAEKAARQMLNDILDSQLRLHLERRCGGLRETIYRYAFLPLEKTP